ncbi:MAG: FAD-binding oxidoreductase, partial [Albidovulum sp.]
MAISGTADVTVIGAGIFGLTCAWECQRRGARVQVIEREAIGAGSSGGIVGALAPHVPENWNAKKAFQLDSLLMAEAFWADVTNQSRLDPGYARSGRIQPLPDAAAVAMAQARVSGAETYWQGRAVWRVISTQDDGWMPAVASGFCIEDTLSARLHPRQAAAALVAAIRAKGGVVEVGLSEPPAEVFLNRRYAGAVIWATGVQGLAEVSADLGKAVGGGVKGQAALLGFDARDRPQIFADGLHIVPHGDGTVAIGSTSEREYETAQGTDTRLDALIDRARAV